MKVTPLRSQTARSRSRSESGSGMPSRSRRSRASASGSPGTSTGSAGSTAGVACSRVGGLLGLHPDRRERGARERAAEDVHHEREPVALVARHLRRSAKRCLASAFLSTVDDLQRLPWLRYGLTTLVEHPSRRQALAVQLVDLDLVVGDAGGRHVQQERPVAARGRGEGDRVGAEHRNRRARRHHRDGARRARHHADEAFLRSERRVVAGGAEVVRVEHAHDRDAHRLGFLDRELHAHHRCGMPEARVRIDQRRNT